MDMQFRYRRRNEIRLFDRAASFSKLLRDYIQNNNWRRWNWKSLQWRNLQVRWKQIDWSPVREPRVIFAASSATVFLAVSAGFIGWNVHRTASWSELFVKGTYMGMIPNEAHTVAALQQTAAAYSIPVALVPVHERVATNYDWQSVSQLPEQAYAITLNGKPLVYTSTARAARSVLADIKTSLTPKTLGAHAKVFFSGKVGVQKENVGVANIVSVATAVDYVLHPGQVAPVARSANLVMADTNESSKSPEVTTLAATSQTASGQSKENSRPQPLLTVTASEVVTKKVNVHFAVKRIKDSNLAAGTVKVKQKGVSGIKEETLQLTYKNGQLASNQVLSTVKVRPVKDEIVLEGTSFYAAIMQEALKYEGYPYVYGGNTPQTSFDCSGLVQWVFGQEGIALPRTAQEQWDVTQHISESQARPGDLVFFSGTYYDPGNVVTHVGIYVGNGVMYDAGNSRVGYDAFTPYLREHLYGFGRVAH